jgi:hypothetical protein
MTSPPYSCAICDTATAQNNRCWVNNQSKASSLSRTWPATSAKRETVWANHAEQIEELSVIMHNTFMAVVEQVEGQYTAFCPEIPEAVVESRTKIGALAVLRVAIVQILDERRERAIDGATPNAIFETIIIE